MCDGAVAVVVVIVMNKSLQLLNWFVTQFCNNVVAAIGVAGRHRPTLSHDASNPILKRVTVIEKKQERERPSTMMISPIIKFS